MQFIFFSPHLTPSSFSLLKSLLWWSHLQKIYIFHFHSVFATEPDLAFLQSGLIYFVSLFCHWFPSFFCLSGNSVALCPAPLPPHSSLTFTVSGCHGQILNLCTHGRSLQLRAQTCELDVYMYTHRRVHAPNLHTHTDMNACFWCISSRCQSFIAHYYSYQKLPIFQSRLILFILCNFSHL